MLRMRISKCQVVSKSNWVDSPTATNWVANVDFVNEIVKLPVSCLLS